MNRSIHLGPVKTITVIKACRFGVANDGDVHAIFRFLGNGGRTSSASSSLRVCTTPWLVRGGIEGCVSDKISHKVNAPTIYGLTLRGLYENDVYFPCRGPFAKICR